MKLDPSGIDKILDNRIRLSIFSILMVEENISFNDLKDQLNLTDGNLASHIRALEKSAYLEVQKSFIGKKPNTKFKATKLGRNAFKKHLAFLEALINKHK